MNILQNLFTGGTTQSLEHAKSRPLGRQSKDDTMKAMASAPRTKAKRFDFSCGAGNDNAQQQKRIAERSSVSNGPSFSERETGHLAPPVPRPQFVPPLWPVAPSYPYYPPPLPPIYAVPSPCYSLPLRQPEQPQQHRPTHCGITGRDLRPVTDTTLLPMRDIGDVLVRYFDVRRFLGRGGKIRFFLRAKHVKHIYEALELSQDAADQISLLQQHLMTSGGSPTGQLPIIQHEGHTLCETVAILRYLAKRLGEYGSDTYRDYLNDMTMDKLAYWSDDLMSAISEANAGLIGQGMTTYVKSRSGYYTIFERLLNLGQSSDAFLNVPTWTTCSIVATVCDDLQLMALGRRLAGDTDDSWLEDPQEQLKLRPRLSNLFSILCELPLVKDMLAEKEAVRLLEEQCCEAEKKQTAPPEQAPTKATTASSYFEPHDQQQSVGADQHLVFDPYRSGYFPTPQSGVVIGAEQSSALPGVRYLEQPPLPSIQSGGLQYSASIWQPYQQLPQPQQLGAFQRAQHYNAWGSLPVGTTPWDRYPLPPPTTRYQQGRAAETFSNESLSRPAPLPNPATLSVPQLQERPIQPDRPSSIRSSRAHDVQVAATPGDSHNDAVPTTAEEEQVIS